MPRPALFFALGFLIVLCIAGPAAGAVTPLWIEPASTGGELRGIVMSADDSTIVAGGAQLICLTREGQKRWSGWSGESLDISRDGDYVLASQGRTVRLISSEGKLLWEQSVEIPITEVSMVPNASFIAATGGGRIQTLSQAGQGIAANASLSVKHIHIMPNGDEVLATTNQGIEMLNETLVTTWSDTNLSQDLIAAAPDGSGFVTASGTRIRLYRGNGNLMWDRKYTFGNAQAIAWSGDYSTIVIGDDHNNVTALNRNGGFLWSGNATNWITSVAVADDGNTIVAGSLDKKVYVYNHAGILLGTYPAKNAIRPHSVAVTRDGTLIVLADQTAVIGLSRLSFAGSAPPLTTVIADETDVPAPVPSTPQIAIARKVTTRALAIPTRYAEETSTPESQSATVVPATAILLAMLALRLRR